MTRGISLSHRHLVQAIHDQMDLYISRFSRHRAEWKFDRSNHQLVVTILLAGYLEALINLFLSMYLSAEQFSMVEKSPPPEKWVSGPSFIWPSYRIEKSKSLYARLNNLFKRRNQVMHMRPELTSEGRHVHKGNPLSFTDKDEETLLDWLRLPIELYAHLERHDPKDKLGFFSVAVEAHTLDVDWKKRLMAARASKVEEGKSSARR